MKIEKINMTTNYNYQTMTIKRIIAYKCIDYSTFLQFTEKMKKDNFLLENYIKEGFNYIGYYSIYESI